MFVTISIITLTTGVSLLALYMNRRWLETGMMRPYRILRKSSWYELITSGFLHASAGHLFVNMFVFLIFGSELEASLGSLHTLSLYLSGIVISSLPTLVKFRNDPTYATLGASGAVGSVLFSFIFLYPNEKLIFLLLPVPIPAWLFAILYLTYSIYESKRGRGKVNHEAHIAGALWGILYMIFLMPDRMFM